MFGNGRISRLIEEALLEDIGMGDITTDTTVSPDAVGTGEIRVKEPGVIAGLEVAAAVFSTVDPEILFSPASSDGSYAEAGTVVASITGRLASILKAERTALNILQRMSGIATVTKKFVDTIKGTNAKITDTRKTPPGLRVLDKLAVRIGGGVNHRFGLDDMVLIKDNHIAAAGGVSAAIEKCLAGVAQRGHRIKIEIETKNCAEVEDALRHRGIDRIMLDNYSLDEMKKAVGIIHHAVEVEASGNVTLERVRAIAETGIDYISVGALTHSVKALDISLDIRQQSSCSPKKS